MLFCEFSQSCKKLLEQLIDYFFEEEIFPGYRQEKCRSSVHSSSAKNQRDHQVPQLQISCIAQNIPEILNFPILLFLTSTKEESSAKSSPLVLSLSFPAPKAFFDNEELLYGQIFPLPAEFLTRKVKSDGHFDLTLLPNQNNAHNLNNNCKLSLPEIFLTNRNY